jgi:hypothetical protein
MWMNAPPHSRMISFAAEMLTLPLTLASAREEPDTGGAAGTMPGDP